MGHIIKDKGKDEGQDFQKGECMLPPPEYLREIVKVSVRKV